MSVFVIHDVFTNDEKHKKVKEFLEKENITFSEHLCKTDLFLEGCINDKLINNEKFDKLMLDKDEFIEEVSCRVLDTNIFDELDELIDDEIDYLIKEIMITDNTVISPDDDYQKSEEEKLVIQIDME